MPIITRASIEELRQRINIFDVVSPVVGLRKVGANYRGLSPFSQEKTPSFYVLPDKNIFKCFSSGEAGDIFKFVQLNERMNFQEAVEALATRFNIQLEYEKSSGKPGFKPSLKKEILEIHDRAADYYHRNFMADTEMGKFIRDYWQNQRKFSLELAESQKIGLSLPDEPKLYAALKRHGYSEEAIDNCGLFYPRRNPHDTRPLLPRFRGRLMVPIREHANQNIVAFTARQLDITPEKDPSHDAKYINSPETPVFNKSYLLFNLHLAKLDASNDLPFVLVEGQLDALRCWSTGITTAVAPQGTSITESQLLLLKRFSDRVICLLDGDSAGRKAALRALPMAWKAGLDISFYPLEEGEDPDDVIQKQGEAFKETLLNNTTSALPFALQSILGKPGQASPRDKTRAAKAIFELIHIMESELMRVEAVNELARLLHLRPDVLAADYHQFILSRPRQAPNDRQSETSVNKGLTADSKSKLTNAEEDLTLALFEHPGLGKILSQVVDNEWIDVSQPSGRILNRILAEAEIDQWMGVNHMEEMLETEEERNCFFNLRSKDVARDKLVRMVEESVTSLFRRHIQQQIQAIDAEIASLPPQDPQMFRLAKRRRELKNSLKSPPRPQLPADLSIS